MFSNEILSSDLRNLPALKSLLPEDIEFYSSSGASLKREWHNAEFVFVSEEPQVSDWVSAHHRTKDGEKKINLIIVFLKLKDTSKFQ